MNLEYLTDPVLRAPTIGCMLMAASAALVGVIAYLRRRSLLGETLSHATYPGVILALFLGASLPFVLGGAFLFALLGLATLSWMERKLGVRQDAALCFVLATFFGVGLTVASRLQFLNPIAFRRAEVYLYGQAATMTDLHIFLYGGLLLLVSTVLVLFYKEILVSTFDANYARHLGVNLTLARAVILTLIALAVVTGIRSVGVILMSAMLIAPPIAARQFSNRLSVIFILAGSFGAISGLLGNILSVVVGGSVGLPTGPMIVLVATAICILSLLFAPQRGVVYRMLRIAAFRRRCRQENLLKALWRHRGEAVPLGILAKRQTIRKGRVRWLLNGLVRRGLVEPAGPHAFRLTAKGSERASYIVRLHRLWEVYLVRYLGVGSERVHHSAEEMEHILTPDIEQQLTEMLADPKEDPHAQPIPQGVLA